MKRGSQGHREILLALGSKESAVKEKREWKREKEKGREGRVVGEGGRARQRERQKERQRQRQRKNRNKRKRQYILDLGALI